MMIMQQHGSVFVLLVIPFQVSGCPRGFNSQVHWRIWYDILLYNNIMLRDTPSPPLDCYIPLSSLTSPAPPPVRCGRWWGLTVSQEEEPQQRGVNDHWKSTTNYLPLRTSLRSKCVGPLPVVSTNLKNQSNFICLSTLCTITAYQVHQQWTSHPALFCLCIQNSQRQDFPNPAYNPCV